MFRKNRYTQAKVIEVLVEAGYSGPTEGIFKIEIDPTCALIHYYPDPSDYSARQRQTATWRLDLRHN